jgi:hypothetical protein
MIRATNTLTVLGGITYATNNHDSRLRRRHACVHTNQVSDICSVVGIHVGRAQATLRRLRR